MTYIKILILFLSLFHELASLSAQTRNDRVSRSSMQAYVDSRASQYQEPGFLDQLSSAFMEKALDIAITGLISKDRSSSDVGMTPEEYQTFYEAHQKEQLKSMMEAHQDRIRKYPERAPSLLVQARFMIEDRKFDEALKYINSAIYHDPKNELGHIMKYEISSKSKNSEEPFSILSQGLKSIPTNHNLLIRRALLSFSQTRIILFQVLSSTHQISILILGILTIS